jgi:Fungalysin/Thermolysin Propeptide Motif/Dickkopf N-terminal cysteine-rich region
MGYDVRESFVPVESQSVRVDQNGKAHIRFKQHVDGLPLEDTSLVDHFDPRTGQVYAVNGEIRNFGSILSNNATEQGAWDCRDAMEIALVEYMNQPGSSTTSRGAGEWVGECPMAAVQGRDGRPYLAYKRLFGNPPRPDLLFADRGTGCLVAVHPQVCRQSAIACDGLGATTKICKACKARRAVCTRTSECCVGLRCTNRKCQYVYDDESSKRMRRAS